MAIRAQAGCTLSTVIDVEAVYTYYYLASSTITVDEAPKDNVNPPGASTITVVSNNVSYVWHITEPELDIQDDVIQTAVGKLYYIECVKFSNGTYDWGPLMTSSTYAAAKAAYNLSSQALAAAQQATDATALLGGHFIYNSTWQTNNTPHSANVVQTVSKNGIDVTQDPTKWDYNVHIGANGIRLRNNELVLSEWLENALRFYHPGSTNKAMELSSSTLKFYASNGSTIQAEFGGNKARISGTINAYDGHIGSDNNNYWYIGNYYDFNQHSSAALISHGSAFIQLADTDTWRITTDRIHSGWNGDSSSTALLFPKIGDEYWDYGMHIPAPEKTKFLYIRKGSEDDLTDLRNGYDSADITDPWTYLFYVDKEGNLHAGDVYSNGVLISGTSAPYLHKSGGTMTGSIIMSNGGIFEGNLTGNVTGNVSGSAGKLSNTSKIGDTNRPVYFTASGIPTEISYEINKTVPSNALFTDENVKTSEANTTKLWIVGSSTSGTNTGTLKYDSNIYIDTTAGALHATTYNGYTLAAASAKGVDTSMPATATNNNVPTTLLMKTFVEGKGYLTSYTETDPTVPSWAKASSKPSYGLTEISGTSDLQAIEALTGTSGLLKKTAANTWTLDTNSYITGITSAMVINALGFTPYDNTNPDGYTTNTGTVTSVRVQASDPLQSSTSTEQTASLNTTISFKKQSVNTVLAGPSSGSTTATPTFRALVAADIPNLSWNKITSDADDLKAIEALTGTSGFLKKTAANTWSLDTTNYVPTSRKVNGHALSSDVTVSKSDVGLGNVKNYAQITAIGQGAGGTLRVWIGDPTSTSTDDYDDIPITITAYEQSTVAKAAALDLAAAVGSTTNPVYFKNDGKPYPITDGTNPITIAKSVPANAVFTDTTYTFDGTYDASSNQAATVSTVTTAIGALDGDLNNTTPGAGKTLTAFSQTDGKISATFGNISITKSQISDFPSELTPAAHSHGNITNGGDITATAPPIASGDQLIINDNSASKITNGPTFDGSTTTKALTPNGTWETFLKTYTEQYTGTVTQVTAGSGLNTSDDKTDDAVKGSITGSGTLYLTKSGATAGSYGPSANAEPGYGSTFNVPYLTVDKYGRVTAVSTKTVKIPASDNTNTTYTLTNALSSHKFTWTFTAGGSGSGFTTTTAELAAGTGITLTDDANNKKITIGCSVVNTDTLMTQNYSTTNNVYPLLMTATAGTSSTSSRGAVTGILNNSMYGNPSKGLINALIYQMNEKADMRYDSTLDAIVFSFA